MSGTTRISPQDFEDTRAVDVLDSAAMAERWGEPVANEDFIPKVPLWQRYRDKVAIVGFTGHREKALELDDSFEIWGLNELYRYMPAQRFHRWFEIHGRDYLCGDDDGKKHIEDLKSKLGPVPIYMQRCWEDIPGSVRFPIEEMCEALGSRYWTNCPAEMIGFAILLGYREIHVYGVDMAQDCLAPDTKVLTADLRYVRADEVAVGDELLGFDEEPGDGTAAVAEHVREEGGGTAISARPRAGRMWRKSTVLGVSTANRPSYRISFEDGTSIVASAGHKWLTYGAHAMQWKRTDELVTASHRSGRPTRVVRGVPVWDHDRSWEAGYLAAAFDGEGFVSQHEHRTGGTHCLSVGFSQRENPMADRVRAELALKNFAWSERANGDTINFSIKGGRPEVMRLLGQIRPERLLEKFDAAKLGLAQRMDAVAVTAIEYVGEVETVGFTTSTRTLVAEGLLSHNSEYAVQRPCCEYWLGRAQGAGVKIYVPDLSDLLKCMGVYGYPDEGNIFAEKLQDRLKFLHAQDNDRLAKIRGLDAQYREKHPALQRECYRIEGAIAELKTQRRTAKNADRLAALEAGLKETQDTMQRLNAEYEAKRQALLNDRNQIIGGIQDVEYLMRAWLPKPSNQAGGNIPTREQRAADPRTGITPSDDSAEKPTLVTA